MLFVLMCLVLTFHFMSVTLGEGLNLSVPQFLLGNIRRLPAPPMGLGWCQASSEGPWPQCLHQANPGSLYPLGTGYN